MKGTDQFKTVIEAYLKDTASKDDQFKQKFESDKKNIDDCITYILNEVKKSGCNGFADDEIYGMALHYYDEENIDVGKKINAQVVVNHKAETPKTEPKKEVKTTAQQKPIESKPIQKLPPIKFDKHGQASLF